MNVDETTVTAILSARTHYDILSVEFSADDKAIKKQYKQLALSVHPDKNAALRADEAFKLLRAAFECLSDPLKRRDYDKSIGEVVRKRPRKPETPEERKKRKEEEKLQKEEEVEKNREEAEAYCAAAAERMDKSRNNWQQWQNKAWGKKKK
eukprot:Phypoly_transcript_21485.p1 GENE.Phypoly_transcript_21485~~Phypoly_transcript_21485.p1  ORF type:complete len:151 (+),score=26.83 Phypoly_transcript_21485:161-613(+)